MLHVQERGNKDYFGLDALHEGGYAQPYHHWGDVGADVEPNCGTHEATHRNPNIFPVFKSDKPNIGSNLLS